MSECTTPGCGQPRGRGRAPLGWVRVTVAVSGRRPDDAELSTWYCTGVCAGQALKVRIESAPPPPVRSVVIRDRVVHKRVFVVGPERVVYRDVDQDPLTVPDALHLLNVFAGVFLNLQTATPIRVKRAIERACQRILDDTAAWQAAQDRHRPTNTTLNEEAASGKVRPDDYCPPREVLEREGWQVDAGFEAAG